MEVVSQGNILPEHDYACNRVSETLNFEHSYAGASLGKESAVKEGVQVPRARLRLRRDPEVAPKTARLKGNKNLASSCSSSESYVGVTEASAMEWADVLPSQVDEGV